MITDSDMVEQLRRELFDAEGETLVAVYRFGSSVRDELRPDSDVDLAFLSLRSPDPTAVYDAAQVLAARVGRDFDLVDLRKASTVMRAQVVGRGSRLHTGDAYAAACFEMYTLSDYARLEEERAEVIAAFKERIVVDDVVLNKVASIERCLGRVRELHRGEDEHLDDQTVEDAVVLNLLRACESSIDLAMHVVAAERLGLPQGSRDAFALLEKAGILDPLVAQRMQRMVGFRNVAIHDYRQLSRPILISILRERLPDFEALCTALMSHGK